MTSRNSKPVRWWPLVVVVVLCGGALAYVNLTDRGDQQGDVMASMGILLAGIALSLLWLLAFSRLRWKLRLGIFALLAIVGIGVGSQLEVDGVSGNLVPILKWRGGDNVVSISSESAASVEIESSDLQEILDTNGYSQFLGPQRNAKVSGLELARDWETQPPEQIWRKPIGEAWSGFSTQGRYAFTQDQDGDEERVVCYDLLTGDIIWEHRDLTRYDNGIGGVGPRATPTITEDRVYALGATGVLNCLGLESGTLIWSRNILDENGAALPDWGVAGSPLISGENVIVSAGGPDGRSLVAYDRLSGELVWSGGSDAAHWSSPMLYEIAGLEQILIFNANGVTAHDVTDGRVLWTYPWKPDHPHVSIPVLLPNDRVLISSGYGNGSALFQVTRGADGVFTSELVWKSLHLKAKFTNVVYKDGYIYGLDDGVFVCVNAETGKRVWKKGRYGHGQIILVGDVLLVTAEQGDIALVEAVPDEYRELARFSAFDGKSWNPPALVGPYLLLRNHKEAACYRLPVIK